MMLQWYDVNKRTGVRQKNGPLVGPFENKKALLRWVAIISKKYKFTPDYEIVIPDP